MNVLTVKKSPGLRGEITVPGDKSITHRALMFGAIAEGLTEIEGFLPAQDCFSTMECLRQLGVTISIEDKGTKAVIKGVGLNGLKKPITSLNAGNSATTMRLLSGILAGQGFDVMVDGDETLRRRPMGRIVIPLREMGVAVSGSGVREFPPLYLKGGDVQPIDYILPVASAQVKSCLILASLYADRSSRIIEPVPCRNHTELMLEYFGGNIKKKKREINIFPVKSLEGKKVKVPGDIFSAAFLMVAAMITPHSELIIKNVGINPTRDGIIEILKKMGGNIDVINKRYLCMEPVADIMVQSSNLRGVKIHGDIIPRLIDELPVIAVAASVAEGTTVIKDAKELRIKESDRIRAIAANLFKMGARVREQEDGMIIDGIKELKGTDINSRGDHRIAMAMAVAGLAARGDTKIKEFCCANVSYPKFAHALSRIGADIL